MCINFAVTKIQQNPQTHKSDMKKLIFSLIFSTSLMLTGCMNTAEKDSMPDQPVNPISPDDPNDKYNKDPNWMDTLRPPLNPSIVECQEDALVRIRTEKAEMR